MAKTTKSEDATTGLDGRPGVEASTGVSDGKFKISIGIKNSFPVESPGSRRWTSISPFISVTKSFDSEPESVLEEVNKLYLAILPAYGYLLLQENAKVLEVAEEKKTLPQLALELLGMGDE